MVRGFCLHLVSLPAGLSNGYKFVMVDENGDEVFEASLESIVAAYRL